ncbi:NAD-P-binding protein [Mycena belliarum]|uniref:NAD-P-binding protein n=1 Tax=Mycena belliarum TaxID=1033014 RepID=A0AAD6U484_9AGAR|nr:NAD-P-binding protein [Mycena belliae]
MASIFGLHTTAEEVANALAREIEGKNILITGTSIYRIVFEAARVLARYASHVVITGYNAKRLQLSEDAIKKEIPSANIRKLTLDLSPLAAVRAAAEEVNAYSEPPHPPPSARSKRPSTTSSSRSDGDEPHRTVPLHEPARPATPAYTSRVIFVASMAHNFCDDSKSANVMTAVELSRRSHGKIKAYSLHPGLIFTNINREEDTLDAFAEYGILAADGGPNLANEWKTIPEGSATTVVAAFDPSLATRLIP